MKDMIKVVNVEVDAINDEIKTRAGTDEQSDLDVCFARFEVGERHPLSDRCRTANNREEPTRALTMMMTVFGRQV